MSASKHTPGRHTGGDWHVGGISIGPFQTSTLGVWVTVAGEDVLICQVGNGPLVNPAENAALLAAAPDLLAALDRLATVVDLTLFLNNRDDICAAHAAAREAIAKATLVDGGP